MARASTQTLIPLDTWASVIGINPLHFNGATGADVFPAMSCDVIWSQYAWQSSEQYVAREDIARALARAETEVYTVAGTWPRPRVMTKTFRIPPNGIITLNDGNPVLRIGTLAPVTIQTNAAVTLLDEDDDGFYESAAITLDVTGQEIDTSAVKVYYAGKLGDPTFEIRPLDKVLLAQNEVSATLTIRAPSYLFFDWTLWERRPTREAPTPIDADSFDSYVTAVDVAQLVCATNQASIMHDSTTVAATVEYHNSNAGQVTVYPDAPCPFVLPGSMAVVSFEIGQPQPDNTLDLLIAEIVLSRLPDAPCSCNYLVRRYQDLRRDTGFTEGRSGSMMPQRLIGNPFGTHVGEINAWQTIANLGYLNVYAGGAL